jgi:glycosyltransferase involved in cell wall biosynthesis
MKILQVIAYLSPKFGGDVNVCSNLSKELVKRNHEVIIITSDFGFDSQYAKTIHDAGVEVIPFHCIANFGQFFYTPSIKKWLEKNLKKFDIIHLHNFRSYQNVVIRSFAVKYGIPYIVQAHGSVLPFFKKQNLKKLYDLVWGDKILENSSKLIALTDTESEQYQTMRVPKNKIKIIPNGLDFKEFENLPNRGEFRRKYQITDDCKIILYIGRLHGTKGLDLLIDAFHKVIKEKINCKLVIIGPDDGYLTQIQSKANYLGLQNKIKIIGFIPNNEKIQALVDSNVFVTPSFSGFPVTFLEACACGLPIITSTQGDNLDWIHNNVGFVVEYNPSRLKDAIFKIIDDEALSRKFSNQGKQLVAEQFNWNAICDQIEMHYREVIYQ